MCGRFALHYDPLKIAKYFRAEGMEDLTPSFNIAPSTQIVTITAPHGDHRQLGKMRWGLIPSWAKDASVGNKLVNARGETVSEKPSFHTAFRNQRCIIPASGFYEWKVEAGKRNPWYITLKSGEPLAMAGLWETWRSPDGEMVRTCCIITTEANELIQSIHDRMPVILDPEQWDAWLSPNERADEILQPMIHPHDAASMQAWPVTRELSKAGLRDDPGLIEPLSNLSKLIEARDPSAPTSQGVLDWESPPTVGKERH